MASHLEWLGVRGVVGALSQVTLDARLRNLNFNQQKASEHRNALFKVFNSEDQGLKEC